MKKKTLTPELSRKIDAWWRAANYLSVGQIYLYDHPLLKKPLKLAHIKPHLLGHWGQPCSRSPWPNWAAIEFRGVSTD